MKTTSKLAATIVALTLSATASADPVLYEFSGSITGGSGPFAIGTELDATFTYDPSTPAFLTDLDGAAIGLGAYGLFSIYLGGVSSFAANIASSSFGADGLAVLVGDGSDDPFSGIFANADDGSPGWTGLAIGDYLLTSFIMYTVGTAEMLADQSMPQVWPYFEDIIGGNNTGFNMVFADSTGAIFRQTIWGNTTGGNVSVQPVPEPGTFALLIIGLAGMGLASRRRKA